MQPHNALDEGASKRVGGVRVTVALARHGSEVLVRDSGPLIGLGEAQQFLVEVGQDIARHGDDVLTGDLGLVVRIESREFQVERQSWRRAPQPKPFARPAGGRF